MARIVIAGAAAFLSAVLLAGCMALPKGETTVFQDPLLERKGTLPLKAAIVTFTDARPPEERQAFGDLESFPERVTLIMLMDFSEASLFTVINHVNASGLQGADVVLKGEIRTLRWRPKHDWVPYIPGLAFLAALGVPVAHSTMDVELALDVVDPKKNQPIVSYTKAASKRKSYIVYRYQDFEAGDDQEKNSAFRQVAVALQMSILEDRDRIVSAVKTTP